MNFAQKLDFSRITKKITPNRILSLEKVPELVDHIVWNNLERPKVGPKGGVEDEVRGRTSVTEARDAESNRTQGEAQDVPSEIK